MPKTIQQKINDADINGSDLLARANEAAEKGQHVKAERLYERCQKWLDISNQLRGNG
jgi:hypothetical protein